MEARKRKRKIRVFVTNLLMFSSVLAIVITLVFITQGWTVDQGGIEQGGLAQFASAPTGATVEIDQTTLYTKTNTKANVLPGTHEFKIWREGYETWYKKTDIKPGQVLWLNYARLIPKEKKTTKVLDFNKLVQSFSFSNRQKMLNISELENGYPEFSLTDIRTDKPKQTNLTMPENLFDYNDQEKEDPTKLRGQFRIIKISNDNSRALIKRTGKDKNEWVIIDINKPADSQNLTREFNIDFQGFEFISDDGVKILAKTGENLRKVDIRDKTMTAAIADGVVEFSTYKKDAIAYTSKIKNSDKVSVNFLKLDTDKPVRIKGEFSNQVKIRLAHYYNENYLHILDGERVLVYKKDFWPTDQKDNFGLAETIMLSFSADLLQTNKEGRILMLSKKDQTYSYDLELNCGYELNINKNNKNETGVKWLDDFMIYDYINGFVTTYDFDGANKQTLVKASDSFPVVASENDKYLFYFNDDGSGRQSLNRLDMIIE